MNVESREKLRVFLADDHPLVLDGIKTLLIADPSLEVVGEARDGRVALRMTIELKPDIVVADLSMPGLNGVELTRQLLVECPRCKVIVLTVHEDRSYFRKLIEVGAVGYVLKRSVSEDLLRAIHSVTAGGIYLDPAIAVMAIEGIANRSHEAADRRVELSEREMEVLQLVAFGHSNKEIGLQLELSARSVETYKARGMDKLGFRRRAQLVSYAIARGWLEDV